ncbi:HGGxSTG domain-containing protein [Cribrihabitans sp. XS_ASV171]
MDRMTGADLAGLRKAAGLSQAGLAQRAGCGRHAVSYWERKPEVDRRAWAVERVTKALGLSDFSAPIRARAAWAERLEAEERARDAAITAKLAKWEQARAEAAAKRRVRCGAKTRKGTPCRAKSVPGKRRCKFHGGMSTGARTPEGIERIREAQRRRWARWRAAQT